MTTYTDEVNIYNPDAISEAIDDAVLAAHVDFETVLQDGGYVTASYIPAEIPAVNITGELRADQIDVESLRSALLQVASLLIGSEDSFHIEASSNRMGFVGSDGTEAAYIAVDPQTGDSVFYMTRSVVVKDMFFGNGKWKWYKRSNNNMSVKWMG